MAFIEAKLDLYLVPQNDSGLDTQHRVDGRVSLVST
jgi:hypothetical protein